MHWIEQGPGVDAAAVVLIHGLGGDAQFWGVEQTALARHYRVLAVDLRGSGWSPGTLEAFSIEDLARDVECMLDEAGISSAHVIGFSMGGVVAQALAVASPHRIKRLVLAATFAIVYPQARLFLEAIGSVYRDGISARQLYELVLPWLFSVAFLDDSRSAPYLAYPDEQGEEQSRDDWLSLLAALLAFDGRARLGAIRTHPDHQRRRRLSRATGRCRGTGPWHPRVRAEDRRGRASHERRIAGRVHRADRTISLAAPAACPRLACLTPVILLRAKP